MPGPRSEPTDEDGALFREACHRADAVDRAEAPAQRWKAWAGFLPSALAALAEGFLREELIIGAVLFSVIVFVIGVTSGDLVWAVVCIATGIFGTVLVLFALGRRWAFGKQWAVILGVPLLQCVLMFAFWKSH